MQSQVFEGDSGYLSTETVPKRAKLRKGTRSCWDCKRRKVKCTFESPSDTQCIACRRRGATCVGQDSPEDVNPHDDRRQFTNRIVRVEALLGEFLGKANHSDERHGSSTEQDLSARKRFDILTPHNGIRSASSAEIAPSFAAYSAHQMQLPSPESSVITPDLIIQEGSEFSDISRELLKAFPSQKDIDIICKSDCASTFHFHHAMTRESHGSEDQAMSLANTLAEIPLASTHPVLVAKRMLILASLLQWISPEQTRRLDEDVMILIKRLTETAIRLVTSNEELVGSLEGVVCIWLEAISQANAGNLRRAWLAIRRAIATAQLMRMDRANPPPLKKIDPNTRLDTAFLWLRTLYMDRYLSLMLGLPQGCPDAFIETQFPGELYNCKLERAHTLIAGRIIERNRDDTLLENVKTTQTLDKELLSAARSIPDSYWLLPNFTAGMENARDTISEIMRLANQLHHYNLVHLVHLPYLLRCEDESYHQYSKVTCVNASREILGRFILFRTFYNLTSCCRTADFFALMAGITILIAHIDSHRTCAGNLLAHQRQSDRAMVIQVLKEMAGVAGARGDNLMHQSTDLLQSLLDIEAEAVQKNNHTAQTALSCLEGECSVLQLPIPYFRVIRIGKEGISAKDWPSNPASSSSAYGNQVDAIDMVNAAPSMDFGSATQDHNSFLPLPVGATHTPLQPMLFEGSTPASIGSQNMQQSFHPSLTASMGDWAFQGVDAALFDSLMRGT